MARAHTYIYTLFKAPVLITRQWPAGQRSKMRWINVCYLQFHPWDIVVDEGGSLQEGGRGLLTRLLYGSRGDWVALLLVPFHLAAPIAGRFFELPSLAKLREPTFTQIQVRLRSFHYKFTSVHVTPALRYHGT